MPRTNSIYRPKTIEELLDKFVPDRQPDQCWLWRGSICGGYGQCGWRKKSYRAHRLVYELLVGAIPKGLELDHTCRTPHCVNPAHLEPVTHNENMRRGRGHRHKRSHCVHGHAFTPENIRWRGTCRICRTCERQRKHWQGGAWNRDKVQCPQGHAYNVANTYIDKTGCRHCRVCRRQSAFNYYHRKKAS